MMHKRWTELVRNGVAYFLLSGGPAITFLMNSATEHTETVNKVSKKWTIEVSQMTIEVDDERWMSQHLKGDKCSGDCGKKGSK